MQCEACGHANVEGARFCAKCGAVLPSEHTGSDPMIGQVVGGRYRVTAVLGEGGMGVVYVGEQQMGSTVRKVAIKTLHAHLSKDPSVLARFHRECGTVAELQHPNTIKFYDFGSTADGTLYIAMEFVAGKSLSDTIQAGPMAPARVVNIMRQVSGALDEAHHKGIIHRDLKPDNVVLTDQVGEADFVKVLDFGIAARSESADAQKEQKLTQQGMVLGTPPYMSPEQFTGKALDARSDVYSLGVMAYEMLTGRLPFEADTPWQWATQHMTAQPIGFEVSAPNKNIPSGMRQAILKSLSKDRDKRPASAREFFKELSDGERLTDQGAAAAAAPAHIATGTSAMDAMPDFSAATAPGPPVHYAPPVGPTAPGPPIPVSPVYPPVVAAPPAHYPARGGGGGGKGLIIGLGVIGGVLLIAIAVVAARGLNTNGEDPTPPLGDVGGTAANPPPTTPPPPTSDPTVVTPTDTAPPPTVPPPVDSSPPPAVSSAPPVASAPPTATSTTRPPSTGTGGTTTRPPNAGGGCDACITRANSGNIQGAAQALASCNDEKAKRACSNRIRGAAPGAASQAAQSGNCAGARAIINAARAAGAATPRLDGALRGTSCQ